LRSRRETGSSGPATSAATRRARRRTTVARPLKLR
jgi:hypothetical protein